IPCVELAWPRRKRQRGDRMKTTHWLLIGMLSAAPALAQWESVTRTNVPRTADGKPNLSAPAPRTPDGKPDLSGLWWMPNPGPANTGVPPKYLNNIAADLKQIGRASCRDMGDGG